MASRIVHQLDTSIFSNFHCLLRNWTAQIILHGLLILVYVLVGWGTNHTSLLVSSQFLQLTVSNGWRLMLNYLTSSNQLFIPLLNQFSASRDLWISLEWSTSYTLMTLNVSTVCAKNQWHFLLPNDLMVRCLPILVVFMQPFMILISFSLLLPILLMLLRLLPLILLWPCLQPISLMSLQLLMKNCSTGMRVANSTRTFWFAQTAEDGVKSSKFV